MNIANLKRQHQEIGQLVNELELFLNQDVTAKSFDISMKIANLAGKLTFHLKSEDEYLYPSLLDSKEIRFQETAQLFIEEMGHIAQLFADYKKKYMSSTHIKQENLNFVRDTKLIILSLRNRIKKEDSQLYPLIENN